MAGRAFIIALVASSIARLGGQKILSEKKKCGDPRCEMLMIRAQANQDYNGPDCRFLSFKAGDEVNVYYKLSGSREDLWQGSTGKAYGFFSKDAVNVEDIFITDEYEVPAQEIDFVCLDGGEYVFENEDSVLHKNRGNEDMDKGFDTKVTRDSSTKYPDDGVLKNGEADPNPQAVRELHEKGSPEKPDWVASDIVRWFGLGKKQETDEKDSEGHPLDVDTLHIREMEPTVDNKLKELNEGQTEETGWFGGRIRKFLPFGEKEAKIVSEKEDDRPLEFSNTNGISKTTYQESNERIPDAGEEAGEIETSSSPGAPSKWFNFGFNKVLGLEKRNEPKKPEVEHGIDESIKNESLEILTASRTELPGHTHSSQSQAAENLDVSKENSDSTRGSQSEDVTETLKDTPPPAHSESSLGLTNPIPEVSKSQSLSGHPDVQTCSVKSESCNYFTEEKTSQLHQEPPGNVKADSVTQNVDILKESPHFPEQRFDASVDESPDFGFLSFAGTDAIPSWDKIYSSLLHIHSSYVNPAVSVTANVINKCHLTFVSENETKVRWDWRQIENVSSPTLPLSHSLSPIQMAMASLLKDSLSVF